MAEMFSTLMLRVNMGAMLRLGNDKGNMLKNRHPSNFGTMPEREGVSVCPIIKTSFFDSHVPNLDDQRIFHRLCAPAFSQAAYCVSYHGRHLVFEL